MFRIVGGQKRRCRLLLQHICIESTCQHLYTALKKMKRWMRGGEMNVKSFNWERHPPTLPSGIFFYFYLFLVFFFFFLLDGIISILIKLFTCHVYTTVNTAYRIQKRREILFLFIFFFILHFHFKALSRMNRAKRTRTGPNDASLIRISIRHDMN
jgi:4-amino-4-deoxy-L-arabinose transferase-like glycosyltransferase